ncbi:hypothetical protein IMSAGC007_01848 [Lachnospiraceae bacterium]|nr:hypothetical protein IMSAGC007_01848 [Lachnospiraceae bacterium]
MAKKYILIGPAHGIGGWQLYIDARCNHLMKKGIDLFLLYDGDVGGKTVKLLNTERARKMNITMDEPYWYSKRHVDEQIKEIIKFIGYRDGDEVFVESTSMIYSFWGELIAEAVHGQNFCYILHSYTRGMPLAWKKFFSYKYDQDLIAGQSDNTLPELFEEYRSIQKDNNRAILAAWEAPICKDRDDCREHIQYLRELKSTGYKLIGYFGVLRKKHFIPLCNDIVQYAENHKNINFCFVAIGSSDTEVELEEKRITAINDGGIENCIAYNIPEMYPVPGELFEMLDICLGSFGSASTAALACKRTIRLQSDLNLDVQGVIGITVSEEEHWLQPVRDETIDDIFDEILFGSNYDSYKYHSPEKWKWGEENHKKIDEQMRPFERRVNGYRYYDVFKMPGQGGISFIKYIVFHAIGIKNGRKIASKIRGLYRVESK